MALTMVGSSLVPLVLDTVLRKKGSGFPACLASSSYFSSPVAWSRGSGPTWSARSTAAVCKPKPRASRDAIGIHKYLSLVEVNQ